MSTWHKQISDSLADAVSGVLQEKKSNGTRLDTVRKEDGDIDNDGDTDSSDQYLKNRRKAISKAIRKPSKRGKKLDLSGKKEQITINPDVNEDFRDERSAMLENLEASFDSVFSYSNKEEESFRNDWMNKFDSLVSAKEPSAYLDPLQRRVAYIEGLTPEQAANRYLSHATANDKFSGGENKASSRGGDKYGSAQHQAVGHTEPVHQPKYRSNYRIK